MHKLTFLILLFLVQYTAIGQQYTKTSENDPKAKAVLDKMKKKYNGYKTLEAEFNLTIEIPEEVSNTQKGKLTQQGDKYRLSLKDRTIVSDGKSVWLHLSKSKEVQINNVEEDVQSGGISSPKDLLQAYAWNKYIYVLSSEFTENGRLVQQIEFKPIDRNSDYTKIRLTVDKKTTDVISIKSFGKDGSRYTLTITKLTPNVNVNTATFQFAKSECPACHFEDLRIN